MPGEAYPRFGSNNLPLQPIFSIVYETRSSITLGPGATLGQQRLSGYPGVAGEWLPGPFLDNAHRAADSAPSPLLVTAFDFGSSRRILTSASKLSWTARLSWGPGRVHNPVTLPPCIKESVSYVFGGQNRRVIESTTYQYLCNNAP